MEGKQFAFAAGFGAYFLSYETLGSTWVPDQRQAMRFILYGVAADRGVKLVMGYIGPMDLIPMSMSDISDYACAAAYSVFAGYILPYGVKAITGINVPTFQQVKKLTS